MSPFLEFQIQAINQKLARKKSEIFTFQILWKFRAILFCVPARILASGITFKRRRLEYRSRYIYIVVLALALGTNAHHANYSTIEKEGKAQFMLKYCVHIYPSCHPQTVLRVPAYCSVNWWKCSNDPLGETAHAAAFVRLENNLVVVLHCVAARAVCSGEARVVSVAGTSLLIWCRCLIVYIVHVVEKTRIV